MSKKIDFDPDFDFIDHLDLGAEQRLKRHLAAAEKSLASAFETLALNRQIAEERAASVVYNAIYQCAEITNENLRQCMTTQRAG